MPGSVGEAEVGLAEGVGVGNADVGIAVGLAVGLLVGLRVVGSGVG